MYLMYVLICISPCEIYIAYFIDPIFYFFQLHWTNVLPSLQAVTWTISSVFHTTTSNSSFPQWMQKLPPNTSNYATGSICSENMSGTCTREQNSSLDSSNILELRKDKSCWLVPQEAEPRTPLCLRMLWGTIYAVRHHLILHQDPGTHFSSSLEHWLLCGTVQTLPRTALADGCCLSSGHTWENLEGMRNLSREVHVSLFPEKNCLWWLPSPPTHNVTMNILVLTHLWVFPWNVLISISLGYLFSSSITKLHSGRSVPI